MPVEQHESKIDIRRGKYDSLDIYEITEDELSTLKLGSPNSVLFNIAISSLSISVTLGVTLLTVTIEEDRSFYVFVIALFVALFSCIITAILWLVSDNNFKKTIKKIERRMEDEEVEDNDDQTTILLKKYIELKK